MFTNKQLETLYQGFNILGDLTGVSFTYAISKNKKLIARELEDLQEAINPSNEYQEYEKKRVPLCEKYCERDDKGEIKMINTVRDERGEIISYNYLFDGENQKKFDDELKKLNEENSKPIEARKKQIEEYDKLMKKESSYKPFMVDYSDVPKGISQKQMDVIFDLVSRKEKKDEKN